MSSGHRRHSTVQDVDGALGPPALRWTGRDEEAMLVDVAGLRDSGVVRASSSGVVGASGGGAALGFAWSVGLGRRE